MSDGHGLYELAFRGAREVLAGRRPLAGDFSREASYDQWSARKKEELRAGRSTVRAAADASGRPDLYGLEARCQREWASSPAIRNEFTCLEAFIAFRKAEARGAARILGRGRGL
jgi:hypothetical protein